MLNSVAGSKWFQMARKAEIELNSLETKFILEIQLPPIEKKEI